MTVLIPTPKPRTGRQGRRLPIDWLKLWYAFKESGMNMNAFTLYKVPELCGFRVVTSTVWSHFKTIEADMAAQKEAGSLAANFCTTEVVEEPAEAVVEQIEAAEEVPVQEQPAVSEQPEIIAEQQETVMPPAIFAPQPEEAAAAINEQPEVSVLPVFARQPQPVLYHLAEPRIHMVFDCSMNDGLQRLAKIAEEHLLIDMAEGRDWVVFVSRDGKKCKIVHRDRVGLTLIEREIHKGCLHRFKVRGRFPPRISRQGLMSYLEGGSFRLMESTTQTPGWLMPRHVIANLSQKSA